MSTLSPRSFTRTRSLWPALLVAGMVALAGLGCSVGEALVGESARSGGAVTKTPRPTFTPLAGIAAVQAQPGNGGLLADLPPGVTVVAPEATPQGQPTGSTNVVLIATSTPRPGEEATPTDMPTPTVTRTAAPTPTPSPTPYVVVDAATVNGRRGPGAGYEVVGEARQGQALMVLGRSEQNDWWQVCCISNQPAWVAAGKVTVNGATQAVPVMTPAPTPTLAPPPTATIAPTPSPTPEPPFDIGEGPLFPIQRDDGVLTIWVKVFEGPPDNEKPLSGYILKVYRDDADVSQPAVSHAGPDFDHSNWSDPTNDLRYNLKFERPQAGEARWKIYLARPNGSRVSPITEFTTLGDAYRNLVVYIAYWLAR